MPWRIKVHPLADKDLFEIAKSNKLEFNQLKTAIKELQKSENVFEIGDRYDMCQSYPHGYEIGAVRFKRRGEKWRCVLVPYKNGAHCKINSKTKPCDIDYLKIIFVGVRTYKTYVSLSLRVSAL